MDTSQLAKMIAGEAISPYQSEYFNRANARYICTLENFLSGTSRSGAPNIIFEFSVLHSDGDGANRKGVDTKIIYSTESWNLKKIKTHLMHILQVGVEVMNDPEQGALLVGQALEPREDRDGKSVLSGTPVLVTTTLDNTEARRKEGKSDYVVYRIDKITEDQYSTEWKLYEANQTPF